MNKKEKCRFLNIPICDSRPQAHTEDVKYKKSSEKKA